MQVCNVYACIEHTRACVCVFAPYRCVRNSVQTGVYGIFNAVRVFVNQSDSECTTRTVVCISQWWFRIAVPWIQNCPMLRPIPLHTHVVYDTLHSSIRNTICPHMHIHPSIHPCTDIVVLYIWSKDAYMIFGSLAHLDTYACLRITIAMNTVSRLLHTDTLPIACVCCNSAIALSNSNRIENLCVQYMSKYAFYSK